MFGITVSDKSIPDLLFVLSWVLVHDYPTRADNAIFNKRIKEKCIGREGRKFVSVSDSTTKPRNGWICLHRSVLCNYNDDNSSVMSNSHANKPNRSVNLAQSASAQVICRSNSHLCLSFRIAQQDAMADPSHLNYLLSLLKPLDKLSHSAIGDVRWWKRYFPDPERKLHLHLEKLGVPQLEEYLSWINPSLIMIEEIGEGAFAKVYKGTLKASSGVSDTQGVFAMKELKPSMLPEVRNFFYFATHRSRQQYGLTFVSSPI